MPIRQQTDMYIVSRCVCVDICHKLEANILNPDTTFFEGFALPGIIEATYYELAPK